MTQLKPQDSQFLYMETANNLSNATMICVYSPPADAEDFDCFQSIKEHIQSRLHVSPIFTRKLKRLPMNLDYPYWIDDRFFNIDSHLFNASLPNPGNWRQLCELAASIHSRPMDMNRPLWEIHIVNKLNNIDETECANVPPGSFALITKIHHVAIDGTSAMRFFQALSDIDPNGTPAADINNIQGIHDNEPTVGKMLYNAIHNHIRSPLQFLNTAARSIPSIAPGVIKSLISHDKSERNTVVHSRFNEAVAPQKSFSACSFPLSDLKSLQALAPESKLNDVVLAICSGALHHYLLAHQDLPATPLIAWVPINARAPKSDSSKTDGNEITAMSANLYTHIADPVARFKAITAATRLSKEAKSGVSARLMTDLSKHMPGATMALASKLILASNVTAKLCNLAVSNVPGPQIPLYIKGAQCVHQYGMVPLADAMGLFLVTLSYNGKMSFSITSSDNIIPDLAFFTECLTLAFNELKDLTNTLSANADRSK